MLIPLRLSAQTDEQLMLRAARGNDRAFEELYNRHARRLQGFFARRLGDDADLAPDFMHDTFLRLYAVRESYREGSSFRAWLYTIAYNLWKNHRRSHLALVPESRVAVGGSPADTTYVDTADIELELDAALLHDALRAVLRSLPESYAMLFSLHYEEELTVPQIAQITNLPEGTVKSRLHKTMNIIKQQLKQYESH
ncbi:MAG: sigma-70 family RNA polymerase sigma factor [Prevotella sp.]|nr:sigma-70 family RNA polymerase sigma factor [Prevotella sp.]